MDQIVVVALVLGCVMSACGQSEDNRPILLPGLMAATNRRAPVIPPLRTNVTPACATLDDEPCSDDVEYTDDLKNFVNDLIARDNSINALISDNSLRDILSDPIPVPRPNTRFGGDTVEETPVCLAQETIIRPKRGKTANGEWAFVVNQESVEQTLRVEKCVSEGSPCSLSATTPEGFRASCRQKYVYRRLLVVGTNKLQPEEVLMPSCCVCYSSNAQFDIHSRSRNATRPAATPSPAAPVHHASPTRRWIGFNNPNGFGYNQYGGHVHG